MKLSNTQWDLVRVSSINSVWSNSNFCLVPALHTMTLIEKKVTRFWHPSYFLLIVKKIYYGTSLEKLLDHKLKEIFKETMLTVGNFKCFIRSLCQVSVIYFHLHKAILRYLSKICNFKVRIFKVINLSTHENFTIGKFFFCHKSNFKTAAVIHVQIRSSCWSLICSKIICQIKNAF